jgi:hypothetical protein
MWFNYNLARQIKLILIFFIIILLSSCKKNDTSVDPNAVQFGTISGKVVEAVSGNPVSKVNIKTTPSTNSILTDESGNFKIENVTPGEYKVTAQKNNYDSSSVTIQVSSGIIASADISLNQTDPSNLITTGALTGKVLDLSTSKPIQNVIITTNPATSSLITDQTGTYSIDKITPGKYTITAKKNSYQSASAEIQITKGKTTTADLVLKFIDTSTVVTPGKVAGVVHDGLTGLGIAGVNVSTVPATSTVTTGNNGSYSIAEVAPGNVKITASKTGYASVTLTVNVESGSTVTADFELVAITGIIEGTVTDGTEKPIAGVNIKTTPGTSTITTDSLGKFRISDITPGVFTISAEKLGYTTTTASVTVKAGIITTADIVMKAQ